MQNATDAMEKQKTELEKLSPLSIDLLKTIIPESLPGVERSNYNITNSMGAGLASGEYELNDSSTISF